MPSPPPPSCCLCPEVEYNAGTTTLKTENVIGYVTDIVLSPLLVSENNPHCYLPIARYQPLVFQSVPTFVSVVVQ